jgi:hypothetical protein
LNKALKTILAAASALAIGGASLTAGAASADPWHGGGGHDHDGGYRGGDRDHDGGYRGGGDREHDGGYRGGGYGDHDGGYRGGGYRDHDGWRDRGGDWHGRDDWGGGFGAGILGVLIGESLSHPYYGATPGGYAGDGYWAYNNNCRAYWRWSYRWHRYVRDQRCY